MVDIRVPQTVPLPGINNPIVEKSTGLAAKAWYLFFETMRTRSGGDIDKVNEAFTGLDVKVDTSTEVQAGGGLSGGGALTGNVSLAVDAASIAGNGLSGTGSVLDALQDTGWTTSTGTPAKGAYVAYAGQTISVGFVQAEAQTTDDGVKALAARVIALEAALRANGAID